MGAAVYGSKYQASGRIRDDLRKQLVVVVHHALSKVQCRKSALRAMYAHFLTIRLSICLKSEALSKKASPFTGLVGRRESSALFGKLDRI